MPLVGAIAAVVDIVANQLVVNTNSRVTLEASPAATLLSVLGETKKNLSFSFVTALGMLVATHLESRDDQLKAVHVGAPRVGPILEGDKIGPREEDPVGAEGVDRLLT